MLKRKRVWIPIVSVLVIAMGCGLFYGRKVANQEPVTIITPVEVEQPATLKPPPPGETYETGHWHGDEWHAEPHDPALEGVDVPVEDDRDVELEAYEASLAHFTAEERATYDRVLRRQITWHKENYPDCQDAEAVFADADRHAKWWVVYEKWTAEWNESRAELKAVRDENDDFFDDFYLNKSADERHEYLKNMSDADKASLAAKLDDWVKRRDAASERSDEVYERKPIKPKPRHTH